MAKGKDNRGGGDPYSYIPNYPTAQQPTRPVSKATEIKSLGAQMQMQGLGQIFASVRQGPAKVATLEAYNQIGVQAAAQIRNRFYKNEWDQVRQTRLQPLIEQLKAYKENFRARSTVAMRPVDTIMTKEEGAVVEQATSSTLPGKKNADGSKDPDQLQPGINPAVNAGQTGAIETKMMQAIIGPDDKPVAFDTPEGYHVFTQQVDQFWAGYEEVNMQMLDVMAEYAGNPYADAAGNGMIENVMKQAGQGVTGRMDPQAQAEYVRNREVEDQEAKLADEQLIGAEMGNVQAQAQSDARTEMARSAASDPRYANNFPEKIRNKLLSGEELTTMQAARAGSIYEEVRKAEASNMQLMAKAGISALPEMLTNSKGWSNWLITNDPATQRAYKQEQTRQAAALVDEALGSNAAAEAYVKAHPELDVSTRNKILMRDANDSLVSDHFAMRVAEPQYARQAEATATYYGYKEQHESNPGFQARASRELDEHRQQGIDDGTWNRSLQALYDTDPYRLLTQLTTGYDVPDTVEARAARKNYLLEQEVDRRIAEDSTPLTGEPWFLRETGKTFDTGPPLSTVPAAAPVEDEILTSAPEPPETAAQATGPLSSSAPVSTIGAPQAISSQEPPPRRGRAALMSGGGGRRTSPSLSGKQIASEIKEAAETPKGVLKAAAYELQSVLKEPVSSFKASVRERRRQIRPPARTRLADPPPVPQWAKDVVNDITGAVERSNNRSKPVPKEFIGDDIINATYEAIKSDLGGLSQDRFKELILNKEDLPKWLQDIKLYMTAQEKARS